MYVLGFARFFFFKKKRVAVKPVEKLISGMGFAAYVSRDQQTFFMTAMGKIDIISSADPPLGLLLVARKCYI